VNLPSSIRNVLLIYKKSTYELYFAKYHLWANSRLNTLTKKSIHEFKKSHESHYLTLKHIQDALESRGIRFCTADRRRNMNYEDYDLVITIGGDGTLLNAAQRIKNQLILGVNSHPSVSVGRFCSATQTNFGQVLESILNSRPEIRRLHRMTMRLNNQPTHIHALNDILICHTNPAAMSHYVIKIGNRNEHHRTSGIWISTAAGSTGAIQSASGKPMPITSKSIQYMPRELYFRRDVNYRLRGGILTKGTGICIESRMEEGVVYVDGARRFLSLGYGDVLKISGSKEPVYIVDWKSRLEAQHLTRSRASQRQN